ncbi:MAG: proline--tRNA ligase [Candidatus Firestonebacteria bacterium]|nr:proline--tRNA ligase [Candidatus Firestonebacteria bacterium]
MRWSRTLIDTLKENPAEAEIVSHQLLMRGGFIRKVAAGIYDYLPLGRRVLLKLEAIVREEMDRAGALEVLLPILSPAELWQESGRWEKYGAELFRIRDRHDREFALGPTHEEVITDLVRKTVKSYRQLPVNLYQMHTKFRDEVRPRFGLMRCREFIMKDAYSFDRDEVGAEKSYQIMFETYQRIFKRCGLRFKAVEADSGAIGGSFSSEFMVLAETGEEGIATCPACSYAANTEKAQGALPDPSQAEAALKPRELVATPGKHTVEEVAAFLNVTPRQLAKTMLYDADGQVVAAIIRGDREINEVKLKNALNAVNLVLASPEQIKAATGAPVGFAGPFGLQGVTQVLMDDSLQGAVNLVTGGNQADMHAVNVTPGRDFTPTRVLDLRLTRAGDLCPRCGKPLDLERGIEVGHVFKLGLKYSEAMHAAFLDEAGQEKLCVMGCYGIGVSRIAAAAIEQNYDEFGIKWPLALAPYAVVLLPVAPKDPAAMAMAEDVYAELQAAGVDVLLDDREERAGVKFKDADLIGFPLRLTFGKSVAENLIELKHRSTGQVEMVPRSEVVAKIKALIQAGI